MSAAEDDRSSAAGARVRDDDPRADALFRAAALVGAAALPLTLIGGILSDPNSYANVNPGSSDAQLIGVLSDSRGQTLWASTFQALGAAALLVFLGPLWARVRAGPNGWRWSRWWGASSPALCCCSGLGYPSLPRLPLTTGMLGLPGS